MAEPIVFSNVNISVFEGKGYQGKGVSRRLFMSVDDIANVPAAMFAVKLSQSPNADRAGKPFFKYFAYKLDDSQPFNSRAPQEITITTPVEEIKSFVLSKLGAIPGVKYSFAVNMKGTFGNIKTPDGTYTIYDEREFPETNGRPGYYLSSDTIATVRLTPAVSQGNEYFRNEIETTMSPDEIFVKVGASKVWGAEDTGSTGFTAAPAAPAAPTAPEAPTSADSMPW